MDQLTTRARRGPAAPDHPVWAVWLQLVGLFPVWNILFTTVRGPGATRMGGTDYVRILRMHPSAMAVFDLLQPTPADVLDGVTALAAVNQRRQERLFRATALLYATIPVGLIALSGDMIPDALLRLIQREWIIAIGYLVLFTAVLLWYSASLWRAHQLVDVLDMVRIERGAGPYTAVELRDS